MIIVSQFFFSFNQQICLDRNLLDAGDLFAPLKELWDALTEASGDTGAP